MQPWSGWSQDRDGKSATLIIEGATLGAKGGFSVCGPGCAAAGGIAGGVAVAYFGDKLLTWALSDGSPTDGAKAEPKGADTPADRPPANPNSPPPDNA
mgnify:CR=1 FL=1